MSSRRKSARPTNKIRQQLEIEEDEDDDLSESTLTRIPASKLTTTSPGTLQLDRNSHPYPKTAKSPCPSKLFPSSASIVPASQQTAMATPQSLLGKSQQVMTSQGQGPHITIPTDIYQDFEALKSATKMDTSELMRKLLKEYQRMASPCQATRERKLDDVIGNLVAAKSSNILDLSKPKADVNFSVSEPNMSISQDYMDDRLAMGDYNNDDNNGDDTKPLDLTLHKHEPAASPDSAIVEDIHSKMSSSTPLFSLALKPHSYTSEDSLPVSPLKPAASYVINLEPSSECQPVTNSTLAQVLQMNIPLQNLGKIQDYTIGPPTEENSSSTLVSDQRKAAITIPTGMHDNYDIRNNFPEAKANPVLSTLASHLEATPKSNLPSYSEALNSVMTSKQTVINTSREEITSCMSNLRTGDQDSQTSALSFVRINAEDTDMKFIPFNLNSQVMAAGLPSTDQSSQQNLCQQQLKAKPLSEYKSLQQQLQQPHQSSLQQQHCTNTVNSLQPLQILPMPGTKAETEVSQETSRLIRPAEISFPNFLLEPQPSRVPSNSPDVSNTTMVSCGISSTSMPIPTFFMTATTNGGMGNMVAIPVIHALPEGVTGLQPFAFQPHPVQPSTTFSSSSTQNSETNASATPTPFSKLPNTSEGPIVGMDGQARNSVVSPSETMDIPALITPRPKPGRPRGRGGRGSSQKAQCKDMKLLTENTLFPGVYTSILKLPWSRRCRNKTKSKTISELKKDAQIIVHDKVKEEEEVKFQGDNTSQQMFNLCEQKDFETDERMTQPIEEQMISEQSSSDFSNQRTNQVDLTQQQNSLHIQQQLKQQQQLKDLEQQKRLHMQYHLRLQEEQRKLTKQIEGSYSTDISQGLGCVSVSSQQMLAIKKELISSECQQPDEVATSLPTTQIHFASDGLHYSPSLPSQDPVMLVYPNTDLSSSKKTPRKRGRPPKVPSLPKTMADDHFVFDVGSLGSAQQKVEPENFLHKNTMISDPVTSVMDIIPPQNCPLNFNQHSSMSLSHDGGPTTQRVKEEMNQDDSNEMTLEKKIQFLTNQIGLEMSKSLIPNKEPDRMNKTEQQAGDMEEDNAAKDDKMYQEMKIVKNKSLVDVKPRRKKVSRILKSDENFMYATFKIKPKGLTPRKTRRKRKDVLSSTAATAETIANLRQKKLQEAVGGFDSSRPPSMVAWKFHEQYPCAVEDTQDMVMDEKKAVCVTCGSFFSYDNNNAVPQQCEACLFGTATTSELVHGGNNNEDDGNKMDTTELELRAECCITCGNIFQKHYSDPSVRCETCRCSVKTVIKSSKLFSLQDSPPEPTQSPSPLPTSTAAKPSRLSFSDKLTMKGSKKGTNNGVKINNNHLFCSLCRMEFSKICDYLAHIRDTHENRKDKEAAVLSDSASSSDVYRKTKVSKTKKSLSHKTLTCPVEDCPHFFREQKDLDLHFIRKHSSLGICPHADCSFTCTASEELDNHLRLDHRPPSATSVSVAVSSGVTEDVNQVNEEKNGSSTSVTEKPLQCEFCDYRCRQKNALTWHMRKHPESASQYTNRRYTSVSLD